MYEYELMSYTVHQAIYFSDGKTESHTFFSPGHRIGICSDCNSRFWKEDARSDLDAYDEKYADLPEVKDLFDLNSMLNEQFQLEIIRFFQKLLEEGFANTRERTLYLREQLWWSINDLVRNSFRPTQLLKFKVTSLKRLRILLKSRKINRKQFNSFKALFNNNLDKLAELLVKVDDSDLLFLAEVYRELGKFDKAKSTLSSVPEKSGKAFKQIKRATFWRKRIVFKIS